MLICMKSYVEGYAVCGNATYKAEEAQKAVDEILERFMKLRTPSWVWESVSTVTSIQVAAPKKLFGRDKVRKMLRNLVVSNWDRFGIIDKGEVVFAVRSLCMDPRRFNGIDLLSSVHDSMSVFVANESATLESEHIMDFSLALSSLCITDYPVDPNLVESLIKLQKEDGSFGQPEHAADATILMLRPIECLSRMSHALFDVQNVTKTVRKMRKFVMSLTTKPGEEKSGKVYIGHDAIMTTNALVALYKTMEPEEDPNEKWRCSEVMDTLGLSPLSTDDEYDLQERLLRITATDYLDMQGPNYKCLDKTDPIPDGYTPTCDYLKPETCGFVSSDAP